MSSESFRRRTQRCVDMSLHGIYQQVRDRPYRRQFLDRLCAAVRQRSSLLEHAPSRSGGTVGATLLYNLLWRERAARRTPESWPGASGHPLHVAHSLASHLFGDYPVPRFLAWGWLQQRTQENMRAQQWFIAHARGEALRALDLPMALTRRMEHALLQTPDHLQLTPALRRAEVLGLGGSEAMAQAVIATPLGTQMADGDWWREVLTWMVARADTLETKDIPRLVAHLAVRRGREVLRGRPVAALLREAELATPKVCGNRRVFRWQPSRWRALSLRIDPCPDEPRAAKWSFVELCDSEALRHEGKYMRHCVESYWRRCVSGRSRIWSLRHLWTCEAKVRSVLTIEIDPARGCIVQVRGKANRHPSGLPLALLARWARREGLVLAPNACGAPLPEAWPALPAPASGVGAIPPAGPPAPQPDALEHALAA